MAQARQLAAAVEQLRVDAVFSSPLGRAASTAARCGAALGLPVIVDDDLAEVDHGEMAGLTLAEIEQRFPGELARRVAAKFDWRFPGGESYADANRRAAVALRRIAAHGARRPLIVSHEMIGRMLLRTLLAADPTTVLATSQPHDVVYQVDARVREWIRIAVPGLPADREPRDRAN